MRDTRVGQVLHLNRVPSNHRKRIVLILFRRRAQLDACQRRIRESIRVNNEVRLIVRGIFFSGKYAREVHRDPT